MARPAYGCSRLGTDFKAQNVCTTWMMFTQVLSDVVFLTHGHRVSITPPPRRRGLTSLSLGMGWIYEFNASGLEKDKCWQQNKFAGPSLPWWRSSDTPMSCATSSDVTGLYRFSIPPSNLHYQINHRNTWIKGCSNFSVLQMTRKGAIADWRRARRQKA